MDLHCYLYDKYGIKYRMTPTMTGINIQIQMAVILTDGLNLLIYGTYKLKNKFAWPITVQLGNTMSG